MQFKQKILLLSSLGVLWASCGLMPQFRSDPTDPEGRASKSLFLDSSSWDGYPTGAVLDGRAPQIKINDCTRITAELKSKNDVTKLLDPVCQSGDSTTFYTEPLRLVPKDPATGDRLYTPYIPNSAATGPRIVACRCANLAGPYYSQAFYFGFYYVKPPTGPTFGRNSCRIGDSIENLANLAKTAFGNNLRPLDFSANPSQTPEFNGANTKAELLRTLPKVKLKLVKQAVGGALSWETIEFNFLSHALKINDAGTIAILYRNRKAPDGRNCDSDRAVNLPITFSDGEVSTRGCNALAIYGGNKQIAGDSESMRYPNSPALVACIRWETKNGVFKKWISPVNLTQAGVAFMNHKTTSAKALVPADARNGAHIDGNGHLKPNSVYYLDGVLDAFDPNYQTGFWALLSRLRDNENNVFAQ